MLGRCPKPETWTFRHQNSDFPIYRKAINVAGNPRTSGSWQGLGQRPKCSIRQTGGKNYG